MALLALDDTDTRSGGCTTHTAHQIARALELAGGPLEPWGLIAPARLVRLNPAAQHRTRGNGALVLPIGARPAHTASELGRIGTWSDGSPIRVPQEPPPLEGPVPPAIQDALRTLVRNHLPSPGRGGDDPQPAAILLDSPPPALLYEHAVARTLTPENAWDHTPPNAIPLTPKGRRGEVGALAAAAWPADPAQTPSTWEYLAYRDPTEVTRDRRLPLEFTPRVAHLPGGFDNLDATTRRLRAVPRTPCPVWFAVRGLDPHALVMHLDAEQLGATHHGGWLVLSNQASGDHARFAPSQITRYGVVRTPARITGAARRGPGGHLFVPATTPSGTVHLAAYEPTKTLRDALGATRAGDELIVLARVHADLGILAVEAFRVERLVPRHHRGGNPRCPRCQRGMKSRGRDAGYRCPDCRLRIGEDGRRENPMDPAPLVTGARFQVPDHVRGHLLPPRDGLAAATTLTGRPGRAILSALTPIDPQAQAAQLPLLFPK